MPDENTGVSYQKLNGRLPAKGCYRNKVCQEIMFIVAGYAQLNINDKEYSVSQGDVVVLQPGEKHFGQYQNTVLITITSPNWSEEQCEVVE